VSVEGRTDQETIGAEEARELIAGPDSVQVFDLRPQEEFAEGRIPGAKNVDPEDLDSAVSDLSEEEQVIVVCADGERSGEIAARLRDEGFDAAIIQGGMGSWTSDKLPLQPREKEEFQGPRRPGPLGQ
jgi:rhodanese-related sulfurtransferase